MSFRVGILMVAFKCSENEGWNAMTEAKPLTRGQMDFLESYFGRSSQQAGLCLSRRFDYKEI
jgi:hypothetical protein